MEERVSVLERQVEELRAAFAASCRANRFVTYEKILRDADEKVAREDYERRRDAAISDHAKFDVFLSLFPAEARPWLFEAFLNVAARSPPPVRGLSDISPWRYDGGASWQATYCVGCSLTLFEFDYDDMLVISGVRYPMTRERIGTVNDIMRSFYRVFL